MIPLPVLIDTHLEEQHPYRKLHFSRKGKKRGSSSIDTRKKKTSYALLLIKCGTIPTRTSVRSARRNIETTSSAQPASADAGSQPSIDHVGTSDLTPSSREEDLPNKEVRVMNP